MEKIICEICGKREAYFIALIEGAKISVCKGCARHGKILYKIREEEGKKKVEIKRKKAIEQEEIIEGYGKKIKEAREKKGWSLEELGRKINETVSFLEHVEKEKMVPTIKLAKKLEKELGIRLIEIVKEVPVEHGDLKGSAEMTLADILESQKKKGK